jgi:arsenite methyltransferase
MEADEIRKAVRTRYAGIAGGRGSCCGPAGGRSGGCAEAGPEEASARAIGYTDEDLRSVPEGANLGLGCGNPVALASLREGETVLDLGAGAGFDCFLAARKVGPEGRVIGVDMTPEMVEKARENARKGGYGNVEFRLGEIENLPVADGSVDAVMSNCVINLAPDKGRVFREAFRALRPGGLLMVSDIVLVRELPEALRDSVAALTGCIAGAARKDDYVAAVASAGFADVGIVAESPFPIEDVASDPFAKAILEELHIHPDVLRDVAGTVLSIGVRGTKPAGTDERGRTGNGER